PQKLEKLIVKMGFSKKPKILGMAVSFEARDGGKLVPKIMEAAIKAHIEIEGIEVHIPSLEDVFIHYTGSSIREEKAENAGFAMRARFHGR
ncbi:MAG: DUF4162 domain-containing protein, partial [Candidatus Micrarchaeota archaeon]|nr:DUF4162 domain-containing protein [Candidatus Micrarchaeota archaeon]